MHTQGLSWALILVTGCFLVLWCFKALKEKNNSSKGDLVGEGELLKTAELAVQGIAGRCVVGSPDLTF